VFDALRSYLSLANGLTEVTRERVKAAARALAAQGGATAEQVSGLTDDLLATSRTNSEALLNVVRSEIDRTLGRFGLVTSDEVSALEARVRELERERQVTARTSRPPAPDAPAAQPVSRKAADTKSSSSGRTAAGGKSTGRKAAGRSATGTKAAGTKAAGTKAAGTKAAGTKATNRTTAATRTAAAQTRTPSRRTTKRSAPSQDGPR
jgi:polyhydroxyalkanoate synthesis regulator phasin